MPFYLTTPLAPTLFSVFAFHHRRLPFIIGICTPSIRCLCNTSSFHPCMHWKGLRLLSSLRAQETSYCTTFTQSLLWASSGKKLLLLAPVVLLQYLVGSRVLLHNLRMPSCNFCSPDFSIFLAYVWQQLILSQHLSSQNRVPIFIPLLYFSFIIRVFINSPFVKLQSPNLTSLEKSPLHQILKYTEPNCSLVSSC